MLPNQVCKLVDTETGEEITEIGEDGMTRPGELWVKGPNVMLGYLNQPEATAETLDADGFLHTGDIAVYHEGGYFSIVDRVKELIKYKGYQIAPAELEALLLSHPKVMDAAVIGVLDDDKQEIPKAFVVAAPELGTDRGGGHVVRRRERRAAQEGAARRVHRGDPEVECRQDPAEGPSRARVRPRVARGDVAPGGGRHPPLA